MCCVRMMDSQSRRFNLYPFSAPLNPSFPLPHPCTFYLLPFTFYLFLSTCFLNTALLSREPNSPEIHLIYTGNLNCTLDDCRCDDELAGGFTRIMAVLDSLRERHPGLILVDAGDFLNSYSLPNANRLMLELLAPAGYAALNLGDQEFVESPAFLKSANPPLPFLSGNVLLKTSREPAAPLRMQKTRAGQISLSILGLVDAEAFEFISAEGLEIIPPEKALQAVQAEVNDPAGLQILLFHGRWQRASELLREFPWIDAVVLAHNQRRQFQVQSGAALAECGSEGEYIGRLRITRAGDSWAFENEFIPIHRRFPPNQEAQQKVDKYYRRLRDGVK